MGLQEIRDWVSKRKDNKVALVDFDKLAWMDHSPPGTYGHNWHYQVHALPQYLSTARPTAVCWFPQTQQMLCSAQIFHVQRAMSVRLRTWPAGTRLKQGFVPQVST